MPKRAPNSSPSSSDAERSSDSDIKPVDLDDHTSDDNSSSKKKAKKPTKKKDNDGVKEKITVRKWTKEEDVIFLEILEKVSSAGLWQAIKEDGRLEYRGGPGIRAHHIAMFNKLKKSPGDGA